MPGLHHWYVLSPPSCCYSYCIYLPWPLASLVDGYTFYSVSQERIMDEIDEEAKRARMQGPKTGANWEVCVVCLSLDCDWDGTCVDTDLCHGLALFFTLRQRWTFFLCFEGLWWGSADDYKWACDFVEVQVSMEWTNPPTLTWPCLLHGRPKL